MAFTRLAISGSLLSWSLRSWVTLRAEAGICLSATAASSALVQAGRSVRSSTARGFNEAGRPAIRLEDDRRPPRGRRARRARRGPCPGTRPSSDRVVLGEDARDQRTDRALAARGTRGRRRRDRSLRSARRARRPVAARSAASSFRLVSIAAVGQEDRCNRRGEPSRRSRADRFSTWLSSCRKASSRPAGRLRSRNARPATSRASRIASSSSSTDSKQRPRRVPGIGLRARQEPFDRAGNERLERRAPALDLARSQPSELGLTGRRAADAGSARRSAGSSGSSTAAALDVEQHRQRVDALELPRRDGDLEPHIRARVVGRA